MIFTDPATERARWAVCDTCDQKAVKVILICEACGCHLPSKVALARTDCPLGKWTFRIMEAESTPPSSSL